MVRLLQHFGLRHVFHRQNKIAAKLVMVQIVDCLAQNGLYVPVPGSFLFQLCCHYIHFFELCASISSSYQCQDSVFAFSFH